MLMLDLQLFGGRGGGSGISGGGSISVKQAFGNRSLSQVARDYVGNLRFRAGSHESADEKYSQMEALAKGKDIGYHSADAVRTQAFDSAPAEYVTKNSKGKSTGWKITQDQDGHMENGHNKLLRDLGGSTQKELGKSLQKAAKQWLQDHPKPSASDKKNYKWNGTEYVRK